MLLEKLDKILALIGAIFSLILIIWMKLVIGSPILVMIGILCFMVCVGYLLIKRFIHPSLITSLDELRGNNRFYITLNILFFILFSYSIIIIYLRPALYIRPLGYFISIALMAVIVSNEILFLSSKNSHICFALCKIIIIGLSLHYSQILIFTNVVGIDPWYHQWFTLNIIDIGYIPEGFAYSKMPMMHLMIGITSLITGLGYKTSTMLSISSLQVVCDALFIFLLGKFLINTKVGLLASLLLEVANQHITYGCNTIPNTMAATLILPIILILFKIRKDKPFIGNSIVLFLMGILILTHTVTTMCVAILLFTSWAASKSYIWLFHKEKPESIQLDLLNISVLFSTGMLAYWSYISGHILTLSNLIKMGFHNPLYKWGDQSLSNIPLWEQIFNNLGMVLFFSISLIGCFYMMSKQFNNSNRFTTTIVGVIILCITLFSLITRKYIISGRWYYFSQILMAIPLSLALFLIVAIFKNKIIKGLLISLSVFVLSLLLIISPNANMDNRLFSPNSVRFTFTESELCGIDTISRIWNGTIGSDRYCRLPFIYQLNKEFKNIDDSLSDGDFTGLQDILIIIRKEILNRPFYSQGGAILKLRYDPYLALDDQKFSHIYDCGSARCYLQP